MAPATRSHDTEPDADLDYESDDADGDCMVAEGRKHFLLQKMIIWARSASARNRSRRNDEMMQQKAAQHVGIQAMGKWRASSFRERQGERLQMRAQVFRLTKQLGTLQTSQMTAAVGNSY